MWAQQWLYTAADGTRQIRILNVAGQLSYYHGELQREDLSAKRGNLSPDKRSHTQIQKTQEEAVDLAYSIESAAQAVDISEGQDWLEIDIKWDEGGIWFAGLAAGFATVLSIINFLQSSSQGGYIASAILLLIALLATYASFAMAANSTSFIIEDKELKIKHRPLPSWRQNRSIGIHEIDQVYVHEKKIVGDFERTYIYSIHARLVDGSNKQLLHDTTLSKEQALLIEQKLEEYLGIVDRSVPEEIKITKVPELPAGPLPLRKSYVDPILTQFYRAGEGEEVLFHGNKLHIAKVTQIDWDSGNSDRDLSLLAADDEQTQLYITQYKTFLHAFLETPLTKMIPGFSADSPPKNLHYQEESYVLSDRQQGKYYPDQDEDFRTAQQWIYENADGTRHLRILQLDGELSAHYGQLFQPDPLNDRLELGPLPDEEIELLRRNWSGKDLV